MTTSILSQITDKTLLGIIHEMVNEGYTLQEALQWVVDDVEDLWVDEFKDLAKSYLVQIS